MEATTSVQNIDLNALNEQYKALNSFERIERIYQDFDTSSVLFTSSFGASAGILLSMVALINPKQKVHFIDTTYHFKETIVYKNQVASQLGLEIIDLLPDIEENAITRNESWWIAKKDDCCNINKVKPLQNIIPNYNVWISGLMAYQTPERSSLPIFLKQNGIIKFHPLIDMSEKEADEIISNASIAPNPLTLEGFNSIGCTHCTKNAEGRAGRWAGSSKSECGLHFVNSKENNI